jgi:hypothetical protein
MLAPNCFTFMRMFISLMALIFACNSNLSLESLRYNLIVKVKAFDNNQ